MTYKNLTEIRSAALGQPTLDLALRLADTQTYDLLRGMGLSMFAASAACDEVLKEIVEQYQKPSMADLVKKMEV